MSVKTLGSSAGGGVAPLSYAFYIRGIFTLGGIDNPGVNVVRLTPIQIPYDMTVDRIVYCTTVAGNVRVGIYADNGNQPDGGALLVESVSLPATANKSEYTIANTALTKGLYWLALNNDAAGLNFNTPFSRIAPGGTLFHRSYNLVYAAFTNPCPATVTLGIGSSAIGWIRVFSIP